MTLEIDDFVSHYILSSHPKNKAIVDIKDKKTGDLRYIKIRHRLPKFYSVSLVDPVTFEAWAETQAKSASAKVKSIVLHGKGTTNDMKQDTSVEFREFSRIGFEWTFSWEGEKYKWVRESRMSSVLECKAIRKTGDICVAQYLPRVLKDEYFGIFSLLGYNILRCKLTKSRELELIILMSLMTLLDKSNDGGWKKDQVSKGLQADVLESYRHATSSASNIEVLPIAYEDPIPKKAQQKKYRAELLNDQKLQLLLEKDVKRSQKQLQQSDHRHQKPSLSADNTPTHTPKTSPLPTPSTSTSNVLRSPKLQLTRQKSASLLAYTTPSASTESSTQNSPTESQSNSSSSRLTKLFGSLQSQMKNTNEPSTTDTPSFEEYKKTSILSQKATYYANNKPRFQTDDYYDDDDEHQLSQHSLPVGYTAAQFTNDFGKLSIHTRRNYDTPPSVRSIRWNPEPTTTYNAQPYGTTTTTTTTTVRRPRLEETRTRSMSFNNEHPMYAYPPPHHVYHTRYPSNHEFYNFNIHPYQQGNHFDYY